MAQSGLSKMIDHADGNNRLAKIAKVLARAERVAADLALLVLGDAPPSAAEKEAIQIVYPAEFDLYTASDVAAAAGDFQSLAANAGALPVTEGHMLSRLMRLCLPGLSDAQYAVCDDEIAGYLAEARRALTGRCDRSARSTLIATSPARRTVRPPSLCRSIRPDGRRHRPNLFEIPQDRGPRTRAIPPAADGDEGVPASADDYVTISRAELDAACSPAARADSTDQEPEPEQVPRARAWPTAGRLGAAQEGPVRPRPRRTRPEGRGPGADVQGRRP